MPAKSDYPYDVFISHNAADRAWVEQTLLPRLEEVGLKTYVSYRDAEVGTPTLKNIERAVDQSLHTLIVMTPEWVQSEWNEFESLLMGTSDPAGRGRRLIPLVLRPCALPARISMLTSADFTDPAQQATEMARLLRTLSSTSQNHKSHHQIAEPQFIEPFHRSVSLFRDQILTVDQYFVGREELITELLSASGSYRVLAILGIPGIGKTKLMRQVAAKFAHSRTFWYEFRLGLLSLEDVLSRLAQFLDSQSEMRGHLISAMRLSTYSQLDRIDLIISKLNENVYYLFFDSIHCIERHSALEGFLIELKKRLKQGTIFIAGREHPTLYTAIDEAKMTVRTRILEGLTVEETQDFFSEHGLSLKSKTIETLHHRLGGLPLALDLAATLFEQGFAETEMVELVDSAQEKTIEYLFTEIYEQLEANEKALLALASLFCLPFPQDQLLKIYGIIFGRPGDKVDFAKLQRRVLIQPFGKKLYQIHEVIRTLALNFDNSLSEHRTQVATYLATELTDNYEAQLEAILLYLQAGKLEQASELTAFMIEHAFIPYDPDLAETILRRFSKEKLSRQRWMWLAGSKGNLAHFWRKFEQAEDHYRTMLNLAEELQDKVAIAMAFQRLGILYSDRNVMIAERYNLDSLALKKDLEDFRGQAQIYNNLGSLYIRQARFVDAQSALEKGLVLHEEINSPEWQKLSLYGNMGHLYAEQEQWENAIQFHRRTLQIAEEVGAPYDIAKSIYNLGLDEKGQGNSEVALNHFTSALEIAKTHHLWEIEELIQIALGKLYYELGNYEDAIPYFSEVAKIQLEIDDKPRLAITYFDIGTFYWYKNEVQQGLIYYEKGIAIFEHLASNREKVQLFLRNIYHLAIKADSPRQLVNALRQLKNRLLTQPTSYALAQAYITLGEIYFDGLHRNRVGFACMQQAIALLDQLQESGEQVHVLTNLGVRYEDAEQYAKALDVYTKAIEISEKHHLLNSSSIIYYNRANCFATIEIWSKAENDYHWAMELVIETMNTKLQDAIRHNLGETYRRQGKFEDALPLLQASLEFAQQHNNVDDQIRTLNNLGLTFQSLTKKQDALVCFEAALTLCCQHYRKLDESNILISFGNFYREDHQPVQAKSYYDQALNAARLAEDNDMIEESVLSLAYAHRQLGTFNEIKDDFKAIAEQADRLKHHNNLIKFLTLAGEINLVDEKELEAAANMFEYALAISVLRTYQQVLQFKTFAELPNPTNDLIEIVSQICAALNDSLRIGGTNLAQSFYEKLIDRILNREHWQQHASWLIDLLKPIEEYLKVIPDQPIWEYVVDTWRKDNEHTR